MAKYRVFETTTFQEDLARTDRAGLGRLRKKLEEQIYPLLRNEPRFGPNIKRLISWEPPTWRYRIGAWRFFYEVDDEEKIIYMTAAAPRGRAYK